MTVTTGCPYTARQSHYYLSLIIPSVRHLLHSYGMLSSPRGCIKLENQSTVTNDMLHGMSPYTRFDYADHEGSGFLGFSSLRKKVKNNTYLKQELFI